MKSLFKSELPKVLHKIQNKPMLVHVIERALELNPVKIWRLCYTKWGCFTAKLVNDMIIRRLTCWNIPMTSHSPFPKMILDDQFILREHMASDAKAFFNYYTHPKVAEFNIAAPIPQNLTEATEEVIYCRRLYYKKQGIYFFCKSFWGFNDKCRNIW